MEIADLREEIVTPDAKAAFDVIVEGFSAHSDFRLQPHEQGFLNSLRIFRGEDCCLAMVPNDEWVLLYIRKPELRRGVLTEEAVMDRFPEARLTKQGEITLRAPDAETARRWLDLVSSA